MKKAIDVVILPSEEMMDYAIKINEGLLKYHEKKIVLDKKTCLPHISLAMGCIDDKDVSRVQDILETIGRQCSPMELEATEIYAGEPQTGDKASVLIVENTRELQLLHEMVTEELSPYLSYYSTAEMLYNPSEVKAGTLHWIDNYRSCSSLENFSPHITVGYGKIEAANLPVKFTASTLAMCHLGNHCTCRVVLASARLGAKS